MDFRHNRQQPEQYILIEGEFFGSVKSIHRRHSDMGGVLSDRAIRNRVNAGLRTWTELNAPPEPHHIANGRHLAKSINDKRLSAKAEMAELLRQLDERKRQIKGL